MFIAEGLWLRTKRRVYYDLARSWTKGMAILFAVGAVSGTILSFELGLLWPVFMHYAGPLIGLPFSYEGFAFFIEAIFIGLYLYGWDRLSPLHHWLCALPIAISGALSAGFVTLVNAWMNMPTGFRFVNGKITDVHPIAAMFSPPWLVEVLHTTIAAYVVTGFGAAAVCAFALLRRNAEERREQVVAGMRIGMMVATVAVIAQFIVGDVIARFDFDNEPAKAAAMEALFHTESHAPLTVGGLVGKDGVRYGIEIPSGLSLMLYFNPNAQVKGLNQIAPDDRPPVAATHLSFDAMVGSASLLVLIALVWAYLTWRRRTLPRLLLGGIAISGPLAVVALEAGWFVTEFGRQPWIVHGVLRTAASVTTAPNLDVFFYAFSIVYVVLAVMCWWLLRRIGSHEHAGKHGAAHAGMVNAS